LSIKETVKEIIKQNWRWITWVNRIYIYFQSS